jgi:hypothetical protein
MKWDTVQQLVRILLYTGGGYFFGEATVEGELFQAAAAGVLSIGAFLWWWMWEHQRN